MSSFKSDEKEFEADVRAIAEAVWNLNPGECQPEFYDARRSLRELDGIARLRDMTHLLMITTSSKLNKIKDDDRVLGLLEGEGVVSSFNNVIHPHRRKTHRVLEILNAPLLSQDPIVRKLMS